MMWHCERLPRLGCLRKDGESVLESSLRHALGVVVLQPSRCWLLLSREVPFAVLDDDDGDDTRMRWSPPDTALPYVPEESQRWQLNNDTRSSTVARVIEVQ